MKRIDHAEASSKFIKATDHMDFHDKRLWDLRKKRDRVSEALPEWEELRALASAIKEHTLTHLATYLEEFPSAQLAGSETFLYWAKSDLASNPSVSLHQMVIYHAPSGDVFIADKLLYASRYVDAALLVISLASSPNGSGFYALVGARASSTMLKGIAARVLRGTVERTTRETVAMYLNWIRASMTSG